MLRTTPKIWFDLSDNEWTPGIVSVKLGNLTIGRAVKTEKDRWNLIINENLVAKVRGTLTDVEIALEESIGITERNWS